MLTHALAIASVLRRCGRVLLFLLYFLIERWLLQALRLAQQFVEILPQTKEREILRRPSQGVAI